MSLEGKSPEEIAALAALADQLGNDPKTRQGFLNLSKVANPNAHIPEVDIPHQVRAIMDSGAKRLEAAEKELQEMKMERSIRAKREALVQSGKASSRDIDAIEKLMLEKHIPDHDTAAEFYRMQQAAAEPTPRDARQNVRETTMPKVDSKLYGKGPAGLAEWARMSAKAALDEMRGKGTIKI